jgi:hypothetical protein
MTVKTTTLSDDQKRCLAAFTAWESERKRHAEMADSAFEMQCVQVFMMRKSTLGWTTLKQLVGAKYSLEKLKVMFDRGEVTYSAINSPIKLADNISKGLLPG